MRLKILLAAALAANLAAPHAVAASPETKPAAKVEQPKLADTAAAKSKPVKLAAAADAARTAGAATAKTSKPKAKKTAPAPSLKVSVDLNKQRMTVMEHGKVKHSWPISSGRKGYRTVTGTFRPKWMAKMHYSRKYDNAPMPHSIFFHGGYAIHATYATGRLGAPASHGCVRLAPGNAKKLFNLVHKHGKARTRISVFGVAKDRAIAKKKTRRKTTSYNARGYKPAAARQKVRRKATKKTYSYTFSNPSTRYTWPGDKPRFQPRYGRY